MRDFDPVAVVALLLSASLFIAAVMGFIVLIGQMCGAGWAT